MKDRYVPTSNKVINHYKLHRIVQNASETFDNFTHRVKAVALLCDFKCDDAGCTVQDTLIRDQIIVGTSNETVREDALKNQWNLTDLTKNGRIIESSAVAVTKIKPEPNFDINKTGKYSKITKNLLENRKKNLSAGNVKNNRVLDMTNVNIVRKNVQHVESMDTHPSHDSVKEEKKPEIKNILGKNKINILTELRKIYLHQMNLLTRTKVQTIQITPQPIHLQVSQYTQSRRREKELPKYSPYRKRPIRGVDVDGSM